MMFSAKVRKKFRIRIAQRTDDHRLGRRAADADRAFLGVQPLMATDEDDDDAEKQAL